MAIRLHSYVNEIFDIAAKHNVDVGVGESMFLCNVRHGKEMYDGSNGVNWAGLTDDYADLCHSAYNYRRAVSKNLQKIVALRKAKKRAEAKALIEGCK